MKTANDVVKGKIVDYNEKTGEITVIAKYDDLDTMQKREYKECNVQMIDARPLSSKQRNACYALIHEISDYTGQGLDSAKEGLKIKFLSQDMQDTANKIFSLSNAPMSLVCAFQNFLINFILEYDIPTNRPILDMVDDYGAYIYACVGNRKCAVCGKDADIHHVDRVGMGGNRKVMVHEGLEVLPLCRIHHTEIHQYGKDKWNDMYHIDHGVKLDKYLCKKTGLKAGKSEIE